MLMLIKNQERLLSIVVTDRMIGQSVIVSTNHCHTVLLAVTNYIRGQIYKRWQNVERVHNH
jgi:hypothetical protein